MSGAPDPLYVLARTALLDAADALAAHLDAVVLVGAQAIYVHAEEADLLDSTLGSVAEYTTDADFSLNPIALGDSPLVTELLMAGGFSAGEQPGEWHSADGVRVDLMVPEALAVAGSRGARLGPHGKRPAPRISQAASRSWDDPNPVRPSPPRRSIICLGCSAAPTVPEPEWLSVQLASTPMRG